MRCMEPPLAAQDKADFDTRLQCQGSEFSAGRPESGRGPRRGWPPGRLNHRECAGGAIGIMPS